MIIDVELPWNLSTAAPTTVVFQPRCEEVMVDLWPGMAGKAIMVLILPLIRPTTERHPCTQHFAEVYTERFLWMWMKAMSLLSKWCHFIPE